MGKILEGHCVSGTEALWVALHGFAFGLVVLMLGLEHLSMTGLTVILAGGAVYLLGLAELTSATALQDWAPLLAAVSAAGLVSMGGARYASGKRFFPEELTTGFAPAVFLAVLGGYVLSAFQLTALKAPGVEEWIPLIAAAGLAGLFAASGARFGGSRAGDASPFFPPVLTTGTGPRTFLLALGTFVAVSFLGKVEGQKGSWEQWIALGGAAAAAGLVAQGGVRYASGGEFFPESLTTGPVPTAVMALLGAFVCTAFNEAVAAAGAKVKGGGPGLQEWMPLALTAAGVGVISQGGARYGADLPFLPDALATGYGPALLTCALGSYTILALQSVAEPKGGLTLWLNLAGAVSVAGALSFYGKKLQAA